MTNPRRTGDRVQWMGLAFDSPTPVLLTGVFVQRAQFGGSETQWADVLTERGWRLVPMLLLTKVTT